MAEVEGSREAMGVVEEERVEVSRELETGSVRTRESEFVERGQKDVSCFCCTK